ncbi:hypothetical protein D3C72_1424560 [compost metagenome]
MQLHEDRDSQRQCGKCVEQQKSAQDVFTSGKGKARQCIGSRRGDQRNDQGLGSGKQQRASHGCPDGRHQRNAGITGFLDVTAPQEAVILDGQMRQHKHEDQRRHHDAEREPEQCGVAQAC